MPKKSDLIARITKFNAGREPQRLQLKYEALQTSDRVARDYESGYLDIAQKSRDINEYAYRRGAASLLDFLDAERSYRATQLGYRQAIAAHLLASEQVRQAVGTRSLQ